MGTSQTRRFVVQLSTKLPPERVDAEDFDRDGQAVTFWLDERCVAYFPSALSVIEIEPKKEERMLTIGRIVHYKLSLTDAQEINRRRVPGVGHGEGWPAGAQAHVGNAVEPGQDYPAIVVAVFGDGPDTSANLQVLLDGNDTFWATSRYEGDGPGFWRWPMKLGGAAS